MRRLAVLAALSLLPFAPANPPEPSAAKDPLDAALPNEALVQPFAEQVPIAFLTRSQNAAAWEKLPGFWNETTEAARDPVTGAAVTRKAVVLKVPLGINTAPLSPPENLLTVAKFDLGRKLYYDKGLSSNNSVSCATCHDPLKGFTDQRTTSLGINSKLGGMNAPTVFNSGLHPRQFWDGRAATLEEQAQGPVGNSSEMFSGKGEPWDEAVLRLRADPDYLSRFRLVFGHLPTRDAAAKAIAAFERTVLSGNSLHDRAGSAQRKRVADDDSEKNELLAADYAEAVKDAFGKKDTAALKALGLDGDASQAAAVGTRLSNGKAVFFGKARCANCHVGDNFSDGGFHNLGVGVEKGRVPGYDFGRYNRLPPGHKDPATVGAFKTPGLRALPSTAPYMHDGSEATLEAVVEFYDRGGNPNEFLDGKMRDAAAEDEYLKAKAGGKPYTGPKPELFSRGGRPVIPFRLNLSAAEKADLVLFLRALAGDGADPAVGDPGRPPAAKVSRR